MSLEALVARLTGLDVRQSNSHNRPGGIVELADGRQVIVKHSDDPGPIPAEVAGLAWLAEPGALDVVDVLGHDEERLVLEHLPPGVRGAGRGRPLRAPDRVAPNVEPCGSCSSRPGWPSSWA